MPVLAVGGENSFGLGMLAHVCTLKPVLLGESVDPGMVQGRLEPVFFGVTALGVALTLNISSSKWGYWISPYWRWRTRA
jgi:hypothetical protein